MTARLILHVEDEANDAFFLERAFKKIQSDFRIHRVKDGHEAIQYLVKLCDSADGAMSATVGLLLLDLKLPGQGGFEILAWVRSQSRFQHLPVIILSGSAVQTDQQRARDLGANAYFTKTPDYMDIAQYINEIFTEEPKAFRA